MNIVSNPSEQEDVALLVSLIAMGLCQSLMKRTVTIKQAERLLFYPGLITRFEAMGIPMDVVRIVHQGTELGDVLSLVPEKYENALRQLQESCLEATRVRIESAVTHEARWLNFSSPKEPECPPSARSITPR